MITDLRMKNKFSGAHILAGAFSALMITSACAGNARDTVGTETPIQIVAKAETADPVRLNLLSGGQPPPVERISALQIGDGSYVCTPAGFGQKSWCRRN